MLHCYRLAIYPALNSGKRGVVAGKKALQTD